MRRQINGRTVQHLAKQLEAAREHGARGLFVAINSCGGFVHESMVTHLMLRHFATETGGPVLSWVGGAGAVAESGASVIMLAGDLVYLHPQSSVMIHQPTGGDDTGRAAALARLVDFYVEHTTMSEPECRGLLLAHGDVRFSPWRAVGIDLADDGMAEADALEIAQSLAREGLSWWRLPQAKTRRRLALEVRRQRRARA